MSLGNKWNFFWKASVHSTERLDKLEQTKVEKWNNLININKRTHLDDRQTDRQVYKFAYN